MSGFVEPAVLGAGIAWWVQALGSYLDGSDPRPTIWALSMGLWFLVYFSTWYFHVIAQTPPQDSSVYKVPVLVADVLDSLAIPVAFLGLGFATGNYDKTSYAWTWLAAAVIPISALLHNKKNLFFKLELISVAVALAIPVWGFSRMVFADAKEPDYPCPLLQGALWIVLVLYMFLPKAFGSQRA
jgi:hypothetical protein